MIYPFLIDCIKSVLKVLADNIILSNNKYNHIQENFLKIFN